MLSPKSISYAQGRDYHKKEIESYHDLALGEWYGKLKDELGLKDLEFDNFDKALSCINPVTGESLLASKKNRKSDRAAIDLTLSAPKSFSVLLSLADAKGDAELKNALLNASNKAINKTLDHIESNYIFARQQKNKVKTIEKTGNLLIAKFAHETARPVTDEKTGEVLVDPDHHYHNLAMNFTKCEDGKFRTLEAKKVFTDKKKLGAFYKSELAKNLKDMGFDIEISNPKYQFFEIKGVDKTLLDEFSQRRKQIEKKAEELRKKYPNMDKAKLFQKATLMSRERKRNITMTREEMYAKNLQRAEKYINVDKLLSSFKEKMKTQSKVIDKTQEQLQTEVKQILKAITEATAEVKKMPKYHQTKYSILDNSNKKLLGKARASDIFNQIKIQEVKKQKQLNTMHEVVIHSLKRGKLDTKKLFKSLNEIKQTPKINIEEILENAKRSDRVRSYAISRSVAHELAKAESTNNRDAISVDREIITRADDRRRERGVKFERYDDNSNQTNRRDKKHVVVTIDDVRFAEREHQKQQNKGVER